MNDLSLYISALIARWWDKLRPPAIVRTNTIETRDPSGLAKRDIDMVRRHIAEVHWKNGMSIEQVAYAQGQEDLLRIIEQKVMGKGNDLTQ